jgi:hypothetical protein
VDLHARPDRYRVHLVEFQLGATRRTPLRGIEHVHARQGSVECEHSVADDTWSLFVDIPDSCPCRETSDRYAYAAREEGARPALSSTQLCLLYSARYILALRSLENSPAMAIRWDMAWPTGLVRIVPSVGAHAFNNSFNPSSRGSGFFTNNGSGHFALFSCA